MTTAPAIAAPTIRTELAATGASAAPELRDQDPGEQPEKKADKTAGHHFPFVCLRYSSYSRKPRKNAIQWNGLTVLPDAFAGGEDRAEPNEVKQEQQPDANHQPERQAARRGNTHRLRRAGVHDFAAFTLLVNRFDRLLITPDVLLLLLSSCDRIAIVPMISRKLATRPTMIMRTRRSRTRRWSSRS